MSIQPLTATLHDTVALAKQGNKTAFQTLVNQVNSTVAAISLAITRDIQDSKDVSQLVFIKMWQQLNQLKNNDSLLPWVRQTTRYTAINFMRDSKKSKHCQLSDDVIEQLLEEVCEVQQHDKQLIQEQQNTLVAHLLEQLPDESREIVVLYYREEQNSKTIAQLLDVSEAMVRKRLQRVRAMLKEEVLQKYGKVLVASAPVGLGTSMAIMAMSSAPAAAASMSYAAAGSQSSWLGKVALFMGGAGLGGIIAIITNNLAMKQTLKNIDNQTDMNILMTYKNQSNVWMAFSCLMLWLSYEFSSGWLFPILSYSLFIAGLVIFINATNKITKQNLLRQAENDSRIHQKIKRQKLACIIGWLFGVGGGSLGLLYGLYQAGRFAAPY